MVLFGFEFGLDLGLDLGTCKAALLWSWVKVQSLAHRVGV